MEIAADVNRRTPEGTGAIKIELDQQDALISPESHKLCQSE